MLYFKNTSPDLFSKSFNVTIYSYVNRDPVPRRVIALWEMVRLVNMLIVFRFLRIIPEIKVGCGLLTLTLWLCSGQIDPKKIFFFPKILVNVIALDSNLLTLFT